jgi:GNAT superfamily N-acetyltransferase
VALFVIDDPADFARRAEPLLAADRTRHTIPLGILHSLVHDPGHYDTHHLWLVEDESGATAGAIQTPPFPPVVLRPANEEAQKELAEGMFALGVEFSGVNGSEPEAGRFASEWARLTETRATVRMALRLHALEHVEPLPHAPGAMRYASEGDAPLLTEWLGAFAVEAGVVDDPDLMERSIRSRLAADPPGLCLWEVDGTPVSLAGHGGNRVGPVYTPPALRGHGYATSLVAELTRRLLAQGHPDCLLFTDLANPTSNAIYRRIGYAPVCDSAQYEFRPLS